MRPRDSRGRFRKANEDLSRFGWLVGGVLALEFAFFLWIQTGARGPL